MKENRYLVIMNSDTLQLYGNYISIVQLLATIVGGSFAYYLFTRSIKEKKKEFIISIYDRLYNNPEIQEILYAADTKTGLDDLRIKVEPGIREEGRQNFAFSGFYRHFGSGKASGH